MNKQIYRKVVARGSKPCVDYLIKLIERNYGYVLLCTPFTTVSGAHAYVRVQITELLPMLRLLNDYMYMDDRIVIQRLYNREYLLTQEGLEKC